MALIQRIRRLERLAQVDEPLELVIGDDGKPMCCKHGRPYRLRKGYKRIRLLDSDGNELSSGLPPCQCQTSHSPARGYVNIA